MSGCGAHGVIITERATGAHLMVALPDGIEPEHILSWEVDVPDRRFDYVTAAGVGTSEILSCYRAEWGEWRGKGQAWDLGEAGREA